MNILRRRGVAIVYITHKLEEVFALADRVTILRDGSVVGSYDIDELDMTTLIERMTGKYVSTDLRQGERAGRPSRKYTPTEEFHRR